MSSAATATVRPKCLLSWSGGKDCSWALHVLRQRGEVDVVALVTTVNEAVDRVAMHGTRTSLLLAQARSVGLPVWRVDLPWPCSNQAYASRMAVLLREAVAAGVSCMAFGDLSLADVRAYREEQLAGSGVVPLFPLWGADTHALAAEMLAAGATAVVCTCDPKRVPASTAGAPWDGSLVASLRALPGAIDVCGENGEFHTLCTGGPAYAHPLRVMPGSGGVVERTGFIYADLELEEEAGTQGGAGASAVGGSCAAPACRAGEVVVHVTAARVAEYPDLAESGVDATYVCPLAKAEQRKSGEEPGDAPASSE